MEDKGVSITDVAYSRYQAREEYKQKFLEVFKVPLSKKFFNNLTGFDVIAFDIFVAPKEGESTWTAIERKYGKQGVDVIKGLMAKESKGLKEVLSKKK